MMRARRADNHVLGGTSSYQVTPGRLVDAGGTHNEESRPLSAGHGVTEPPRAARQRLTLLDAKATIRMV